MASSLIHTIVARKQHYCLWCKESIQKAETYIRRSWVEENMHGRDAFHIECHDAVQTAPQDMQDWWYDEGCIPEMQRGHTHELGYTHADCAACQKLQNQKNEP